MAISRGRICLRQTPDLRPPTYLLSVYRLPSSVLQPPRPTSDLIQPPILHYQFVDILALGPAFCFQHGPRVKLLDWTKA